ncbi:hypothetical protein FRC17_009185, partial [Serendipita sp. 399]
MSQRRAITIHDIQGKSRTTASGASVISTSSSTPNLSPFEGLGAQEISFIDAIISRVPSSVTKFVSVYKAYQDEFEERGLSSSDDQFYYHLLLKLGMIRAESWQDKWTIVKEHFDYDSQHVARQTSDPTPSEPPKYAIAYRPAYDDDDAFTLNSQPDSIEPAQTLAAIEQTPKPRGQQQTPAQIATSTRYSSSNTPGVPSIFQSAGQRRSSSATTREEATATTNDDEDPRGATTTLWRQPKQLQLVTPRATRTEKTPTVSKGDVDTWKMIEMERDADIFRRESLLARCLDVWVKGLQWVETTTAQLDQARAEFLLRSVITTWRAKAADGIEEVRRAGKMDTLRLLSFSLSKWRMKAWNARRARWAEDMKGKMVQLQRAVDSRLLSATLKKWHEAWILQRADRQYQRAILRTALTKWNRRLSSLVDLSSRAEQVVKHANTSILEDALTVWKRRVHLNVVARILQEKQADRIKWQFIRLWKQKTQMYSVAGGFSDARVLRESLHKWIRRQERLKQLERRAIAHQNRPLIRANRLQKRDRRLLAAALEVWCQRLQHNKEMERCADHFEVQISRRIAHESLRVWANKLAERRKLERRAQKAYEATLKAKIIFQWRKGMWEHARDMKQAKLARRLFLERSTWRRWKELADCRVRESKLHLFQEKRLRALFTIWTARMKQQRNLRRKEEVVMMTTQARILKEALQSWTLRVLFLKDREYCVIQDRREKDLRYAYPTPTVPYFNLIAVTSPKNGTSGEKARYDPPVVTFNLFSSELLRRVLNLWVHSTHRKRSLLEREEEFNRGLLSVALEKWRDKYIENSLRPAELDVLLQSQTNLLFKMFRIWEARTTAIPAIRFHAHQIRTKAWNQWKAAMPAALQRKEAKDHHRLVLLGKSLKRWRAAYNAKVSLKAAARARYLRLPPAPPKSAASRMMLVKPKVGTRSYRSASPDRETTITRVIPPAPRAESSRAPSPTSTRTSFHALGIAKKRPVFGAPSSVAGSRSSLDGREGGSSLWDGLGATRAQARATFASGLRRPSSIYQDRRPRSDIHSIHPGAKWVRSACPQRRPLQMDRKRHIEEDAESSVSKKAKFDAAPKEDLVARAKAVAARLAKAGIGSTTSVTTPAVVPPPSLPPKPVAASSIVLPDKEEIARRVAEARQRVANATTQAALSSNPYISAPSQGKKKVPVAEVTVPQGTGLKMKAHPLLLETASAVAKPAQSKKDRFKPMAPKFASTKANARISTATTVSSLAPVKANPYTTRATPHEGFEGAPKERVGRALQFGAKGKYIAKGNQMRNQAQIEALKQRVAASAQKAGLESSFDVVERSFRREPPPEAEWWDSSLLPNKTYADVANGVHTLNIRTDDSPITLYIQHPIPLPPPGEKNKVESKPLKLTTKEQKKLRKKRRAEEMQDHQDRVRMGLIPPDPPKVRMANMVRVLTNEAVTDPTKLEARIRREVQGRKNAHEKANQDRKLTAEQRRDKLETKKLEDERKGLCATLFRIKTLTDPSHQFKILKNAQQDGLTGICIINPNVSLVYVEGGSKGMKHYTRLMEHRIDWTQPSRRRDVGDNAEEPEEEDAMDHEPAPTTPVDGPSLADNRCDVLWQGSIGEHTFHSFKT